jgi:acyl-CoA reductase-like NAD-dependent aldehyde dehydrogenase
VAGRYPVAGPYFNFTVPEPTGVVGVLAPEEPPPLGLTERLAPALVGGNTVVAVAAEAAPLAAITMSEVIATSDVPAGVINLLTRKKSELSPWLASHMDVKAVDRLGAPEASSGELEALAAENVKRVAGSSTGRSLWHAAEFLELKTVWHPIGV